MALLLSLLTTGRAELLQREVPQLVGLTHLLKLASIPVAVVAEEVAGPVSGPVLAEPCPRAVITFLPGSGPGTRGRPAQPCSSAGTEAPPSGGALLLQSLRRPVEEVLPSVEVKTRIGVEVEAESPEGKEGGDLVFSELEVTEAGSSVELETEPGVWAGGGWAAAESGEEEVEEMEVTVSREGRVERLQLLRPAGRQEEVEETLAVFCLETKQEQEKTEERVVTEREEGVTVLQAEEGEGLDSLISVAEAFEKSQQPDFNDIASPLVDGTDTDRHLVRNCVICSKALLGRNALGRHVKNVHPKVFGPYRCSVPGCGKLAESGAKMVAHHSQLHTGGSTKLAQARPSFQCSVVGCQGVFASGGRLAEHLRKEHEMADCGQQRLAFPCNAGLETCVDVFTTARGFIAHMKEEHQMKPWLCGPCDKRFMERQNMQFHLMSHGNKKNFACDICNKSFSNPRQLYTHRALHLGKRFLCQDCGYRARSSANLRGHVKAKHEARGHTCDLCNKKFSSGNNLRNHQRIHTGEAPYECELCGVKFKRMHHLHSHIESKMHLDIMEKCRRKGHPIPPRLDPIRRARGRAMVEDGPVTLVTHGGGEAAEGWAATQVVVVEEAVGDFVIPVEETQVEVGGHGVLQEATYTFSV